MNAVIHQLPELPGVGLLPVAGRPLIARQLQWLRTIGCGAIAVEIAAEAESAEIARWVAEADAIGAGVSLVLTGRPLSSVEIARRASFSLEAPLLAMPADVVAGGRLFAPAEAQTKAPDALAGQLAAGQVCLVPGQGAAPESLALPGWAVRVRSLADAMALSAAVLDGRLSHRPEDPSWGVPVHAAEASPGVWISRGARVESGAELIAPVLIGKDAIVCSGARVGPRVCVGDRVVIGADTALEDALVSAGTIVGEGLAFAGVAVEPHGFIDLRTGELIEIGDRLVLTERDSGKTPGLLMRGISLVLFILLLPFAALLTLFPAPLGGESAAERHATVLLDRRLVVLTNGAADLLTRLFEAARGRRALIGVPPWAGPWPEDVSTAVYEGALSAPQGIFSVDAALVPPGAEAETRLFARAWYAHAKSFSVDVKLVARCVKGALGWRIG